MAIKKILQNVLGEKRYLSLLAGTFQRIYPTGWLGKEYQDIYFLKKIIREGDWCLDIGAHLGYFTLELSRLAGKSGKVFAIEPMSPFHNTLRALLERKRAGNVTLYQVALGGKGDYVEMGIPRLGATKRFACARIMESSAHLEYVETEKVKNETGDHLFRELSRLDYIKCDVEGLEYEVFLSLMKTLETHHPILLCELFERGLRIRLFELLRPLGYHAYSLVKGRLHRLDVYTEETVASHNLYFIPSHREERVKHLLNG